MRLPETDPLNTRSGYRHTRGAAQPAEPARELTQALPPNAAITGGRANSRPGEVQTELPAGRVTLAEEQWPLRPTPAPTPIETLAQDATTSCETEPIR